MPDTDRHHAFQYFFIWEQLRNYRTAAGLPIPQDKLLKLWWKIVWGKQRYVTAQLWAPVQELQPNQSFPKHIAIILFLIHYFGFGANAIVPSQCIPNQVQAGDCLTYYLCCNLRYDITMTPTLYLAEFQLALRFLASLEQLWEPPITANKHATIFLHSFPHHMVQQFCTDPGSQVDPSGLTLDHIAARTESILDDKFVI